VTSIAFPVAFLALGLEYVLVGVKVLRAGDDDVERGFAFFVTCIGIAGILLSGTQLLRASTFQGPLFEYSLAIGNYGTPMLYAIASVAWFAFALRYVATVSIGFRPLVAGLSMPVVTLMPLATTVAHLTDGDPESFPLLAESVTPILQLASFVVAPYHFALALAGVAVVLWAVYRYGQPSLQFALLLYIGGPFWYFSNYVTAPVFGVSNDVFFGINLLIGGVGFAALWQIHRPERLHEERPATSVLGREKVVDGLRDPIVAIDRNGRIADANSAADRLFDLDLQDRRGRPIDEVRPEWMADADLGTPGTDELSTDDGKILQTSVARITDDSDRTFGHVAVFRDVTDDRHREQRLQVLNRVLRHNLRNEGNFVDGAVDMLVEAPEEREKYRELIHERIERLVSTGTKARTIERVVEADRRGNGTTPVSTVLDRAVGQTASDRRDAVAIESEMTVPVRANDFVLEAVVGELVENALEHGGSDVSVTVNSERCPTGDLEISVEDDGPGIPDHETTVLEKGKEGPLEHGSGVGLWLVTWGTERLGGGVRFETPSSGGTRAVLRLPPKLIVDGDPDESE